jgi:hypothetical protein
METQEPQAQNTYTFGDSEHAAERLFHLARTFEPSTLDFVTAHAPTHLQTCIDLGAGPGFLSAALHRMLAPVSTIGLESSPNFIAFGTPHLPRGVTLLAHDVTERLPVRGELLVARFLVTHLRSPGRALQTWKESKTDSADLLLEELVGMDAELPQLRVYYALVARVQAAVGQNMHIGTELPVLARAAGLRVMHEAQVLLQLPVSQMARLHALNLPALRIQPVVKDNYAPAELDRLQAELEALSAGASDAAVQVHMAHCACR